MDGLYSLENARKFKWASLSGELNPERIGHLNTYVTGTSILDAGCGGGAYVEYLAAQGLAVTGCDKHDQFLRVAQEHGRLGRYVLGDITALQFADDAFDCTYCFDVLEHVDDTQAIQELARVTSRRLILAVPREDDLMRTFNLTFLHYQDRTHLRYYTEDSIRDLLSGVPHSQLRIFPELLVPVESCVREMLTFQSTSRLSPLYRRVYHRTFNWLMEKASFREIPTGLVAVVDL